MDSIKLTDAQTELITTHLPHHIERIIDHKLQIDNMKQFVLELEELVVRLEHQPYTQETARERFAAKYLYRKLLDHNGQPIDPIKDQPLTDDQIHTGMTVRLINDTEKQTFTVKHQNLDGSWCVYGGTAYYKQFRDFKSSRLTTT